MSATPIILDCDPGHDDAIALLLALGSPEVDLIGVTTVSGNQTIDKTTANAHPRARVRRARRCARSTVAPPLRSCASRARPRTCTARAGSTAPTCRPPTVTERPEHAVDFLAREIRAREGRLTLIPTGPLTNIALLLALHPDARPERIVLMGGSIGEGNKTPAAEFNIWADPEAAKRVFASGIDTTMIGLDVTHKALITDEHTERLRAAGRVGTLVAELMDFYSRFHRANYPDLTGLADARPRRRRARARARARRDEAGLDRRRLQLGAGERSHERRLARPLGEPAERARRCRRGCRRIRRAPDRARHLARLSGCRVICATNRKA